MRYIRYMALEIYKYGPKKKKKNILLKNIFAAFLFRCFQDHMIEFREFQGHRMILLLTDVKILVLYISNIYGMV